MNRAGKGRRMLNERRGAGSWGVQKKRKALRTSSGLIVQGEGRAW